MGQIQNALNQLAGSTMGLALGASHSPYIRGQRAIKQAGQRISSIQETLVKNKNAEANEKEIIPEIAKAYDAYENAILQGGTKEQIQALYDAGFAGDATVQGGNNPGLPYLEYEAEWPGTKSIRDTYYNDPESADFTLYWDKDTLNSIKEAYEAKRGVQNSVLERYQTWLEKPPVEAPANPGFKQPKPLKVVYQNPGYKPVAKPEVVVEKGETAPETPDTYQETATAKLDKPGSRLYKG